MISAVIITKNEAQNIKACIEALQEVADEILVLDSGSEDATVKIAQRLGARVEETEWLGYSRTKNKGNKLASHNYILSIDADEIPSKELTASILVNKKNITEAYSFNRLTFYCGKAIRHCGWYPDTKVRLFPKGMAEWQGSVHEQLVLKKGLRVKTISGDLLHYSIESKAAHEAVARKYAQLKAEEMFQKNKKFNSLKFLISPIVRFCKMYFLKSGWLDGKAGLQICYISALAVKWKYAYLKELESGA